MAVGEIISGGLGLLGNLFNSGPSAEELAAERLLGNNFQDLSKIGDYSNIPLNYMPSYYSNPEAAQATTVSEDPQLRAAQISALQNLLTRSNEGITAEEARQQDLSRRKQGETTRGAEEAIINNMAARGLGGSGQEFALRQMAAQNAGDVATQEGLAREATNAEEKRNALMNLISGSATVRGQDYTVNKGNADITNNFAMENSRRRNAIREANTNLANTAQMANKTANRTDYTDAYNAKVARQKAINDARTTQAQMKLGQNVQRGNEANNIIGSAANLGAGIYNTVTGTPSTPSGGATALTPEQKRLLGIS